jgi:hypothetical protein
MSFKKSETKPTTTAPATTEAEQKKSYDKLLAKLDARGIALYEFANVKESRRKKMLQDEYQDIKNESGWLYDEPIEFPSEVLAKEKDLQKAKLEAASKVK